MDQLRLLLQYPRGVAEGELQEEREESGDHSEESQCVGARSRQ